MQTIVDKLLVYVCVTVCVCTVRVQSVHAVVGRLNSFNNKINNKKN